jgi:hypothetical protein
VNAYKAEMKPTGGYLYVMGDREKLAPALAKLYPGTEVHIVQLSAMK